MAKIREDAAQQRQSGHLLHRMKAIIDVVKPSRNTWQTVCADSYFASVPAIDNLEKIVLMSYVHTDT